MTAKYPLATIASFLWIGFVCAISFMEAWLKFQAPGVTLPIGLSIGKIIFSALNNVEWIFAVLIIVSLILKNITILKWKNLTIAVPFVLLVLQTFWLLPVLNERAELQIHGQAVAASNFHFYYVAMEAVKVFSLFTFGLYLLKGKI